MSLVAAQMVGDGCPSHGGALAQRRPRSYSPVPEVRVLESRGDGAHVVEIRTPLSDNPLSRTYRVLSAIGVRSVHTEVRVAPDTFVQKLHLVEPDDSHLSHHRLTTALRALRAACLGVTDEAW